MESGTFDAIFFFFIITAHYCTSLNTAEIKKGNLCLQFQTTSNKTLNQKAFTFIFGSEKWEGGDGRSHQKALLKVYLQVA